MYRHPNSEEFCDSNNDEVQDESSFTKDPIHSNGHSSCSEVQRISPDNPQAQQEEQNNSIPVDKNSDTYFNYLWKLARDGDSNALNKLSILIAPELQRIAQILLSKERQDHTLTTNALINELYLRLLSNDLITINDRSHFFALAAKRMRFILIDHARKRNNQKNNNGQKPSTLDESLYDRVVSPEEHVENILDIDKALTELEKIHVGWARVVELRYFGGFQFIEIAEIMNINKRRAERYWSRARTWLFNYLKSN